MELHKFAPKQATDCPWRLSHLSFFSEISETEGCGRLGFTLAAKADDYQYRDGYEIGYHLIEAGDSFNIGDAEHLRKEVVQPVEETEEVCTPDRVERSPGGEDYERNCKPAEGFNLS